jgi:hypothetical protein
VATADSHELRVWFLEQIPRLVQSLELRPNVGIPQMPMAADADKIERVLRDWAALLIGRRSHDGVMRAYHGKESNGPLALQVCHILRLEWTELEGTVRSARPLGLLFLAGKAANTADVGLSVTSLNHVLQGWIPAQLLHAALNSLNGRASGGGCGNADDFRYLDRLLEYRGNLFLLKL